jgi:predicted RNase H-like HicB family nuclease
VDAPTRIVEFAREEDGRWIAELPALPGALAYGATREQAITRVVTLALRVLADRASHDGHESGPGTLARIGGHTGLTPDDP